ncbi:ribosomal-processing cysteine protease Prp [Veillonella sp. CHU110]|uniref:ribosomal-processing cysteine protease Prp n=1 Tax=Veillonella sp. CHU110 TaxID=2490947 RepID=UPI000F8E271C|nr:ribosomal-processing cysteine protease Prp [Veillonella sp. CHU110]
MTHIDVKRNVDGHIVECHFRGHAEAGPYGEDIVCAAISMLSQTSLLGLHEVAQQSVEYRIEDGELDILLSEPITERGQTILETMLLGIKNVANQYSDFVRVSEQ